MCGVNGLANVVCFPWALSDRTGFTDLYLSADNSGDHRIYLHEGRTAERAGPRRGARLALGDQASG